MNNNLNNNSQDNMVNQTENGAPATLQAVDNTVSSAETEDLLSAKQDSVVTDPSSKEMLTDSLTTPSEVPEIVNDSNATKKKNIIMIGVIVVFLVVASVVILLVLNFEKLKKNDGGLNKPVESKQSVSNWDDYTLFIDGNEINLPMKFSEFEKMGFHEMETFWGSVLDDNVEAKSRFGSTYNSNFNRLYGLFTNDVTSNIFLNIYNDSNEDKPVKDCYVTGVGFEITASTIKDFTIGDVKIVNNTKNVEAIIGKTTYDDVVNKLGHHYKYDYKNTLTYYPDKKADGEIDEDDLNVYYGLYLFFDNSTLVLDAYDFHYYDMGTFEGSRN